MICICLEIICYKRVTAKRLISKYCNIYFFFYFLIQYTERIQKIKLFSSETVKNKERISLSISPHAFPLWAHIGSQHWAHKPQCSITKWLCAYHIQDHTRGMWKLNFFSLHLPTMFVGMLHISYWILNK